MISSLHGKLESLGSDWAIVNVNGIGFQVYTPTSTLSTLGTAGDDVKLYTHLHLREDNVTLYGFGSTEELWLFETLIGVSGLGPRLALAMLSAMSVDQLTMAIATGSTELLTTVPGIGKKVADRLILELKDKIGAGCGLLRRRSHQGGSHPAPRPEFIFRGQNQAGAGVFWGEVNG